MHDAIFRMDLRMPNQVLRLSTELSIQTFGAKVFADFRFESLYRYYLQSLQTSDESLKLKVLLKVSRLDWAFLNPFEKWHHASGFI